DARLLRAAAARKGTVANQDLQQLFDSRFECGADGFRLSRGIAAQSGQRAADVAGIAVRTRYITLKEAGRVHVCRLRCGLLNAARSCFFHQLRLGCEMLVEAPMGEACSGHQVGNAHTVVATLAKQPGCGLDDALAVGLCLRFGDFHTRGPLNSWWGNEPSYFDNIRHQSLDFLDYD